METKKRSRCLILKYMDGKRDVLQLDVDFSPNLFVHDGVLNVRARFSTAAEFDWHYFPLCNIRHYETKDGEMA